MAKSVKQSGIPQLRAPRPSSIPRLQTEDNDDEKAPKQAAGVQRPSLLRNLFALKDADQQRGLEGPGRFSADCSRAANKRHRNSHWLAEGALPDLVAAAQLRGGQARARLSETFLLAGDDDDLDATLTEHHQEQQELVVSVVRPGQRVKVCGQQVGTVRYVGAFHRAHGVYCGVELDQPEGLNDGSVEGKRYFMCRKKYGIIAPMERVTPLTSPEACRLRRDTFCVSEGDPAPSHVTSQPDPLASRQDDSIEPCETSPCSPGGCGADWGGDPAPGQAACSPSKCHTSLWELSRHNSFEQDESLGILSPDQMKTDLTLYGGDASTPYRQAQQSEDFQWTRFMDLTCEASLLDNQECPIYLHDTVDESRDDCLASPQPPGEGKQPPSTLPLKLKEPSKSPSDAFTPASAQADVSDRTLSPEDLPLDEVCDQHVDLKALDVAETSEFTGPASAEPSSRSSAPAVSSFVTSVTSITSLDNGYQGDGECSRPGSRGPDHYSPTAGHRPSLAGALRVKGGTSAPPQDTMTDSDFFTESDADVHEELSALTGAGRGDRKAQVIDGTLYGSSESHSSVSQSNGGSTVLLGHATQKQQHQRCPSFTASINEEMESSGVYSDLERRPDPEVDDTLKVLPVEPEVPDCSPDVSAKTSSRSEHSQLKGVFPFPGSPTAMPPDVTVVACRVATEGAKSVRAVAAGPVAEPPELVGGPSPSDATVAERTDTANPVVPASESKPAKPDGPYAMKKYKMPKRNVASKVKTMIDSPPAGAGRGDGAEDQENKRPARTKSPRKGGRWDAVMSKIAQGQAENKWTPTKLKDVKSKVLLNILPPPGATGALHQGAGPPRKTSLLPATRLSHDNSLKSKTRRNRTRASSSSLSQAQAGALAGSINSSAHSSVSDLSVDHAQRTLCKVSSKANSALGSSKKREVGRSTSPLSDGSTNSATSHVMTRPAANHHPPPGQPRQSTRSAEERRDGGAANQQKRQPRNVRSLAATGSKRMQLLMGRQPTSSEEKNGVSLLAAVDMKTPTSRKTASRRSPAVVQKPPTPLRDHNSRQQQQAGGGATKAQEAAVAAPKKAAVTAPAPPPEERLLPLLKHNAAGFEALSVLVQYLVFDLEAFATPQLRRNLDHLNGEWVRTRLELEEAQASYRRLGEEMCQKVADQRRETEQAASSYRQQLADLEAAHAHQLDQVGERHAAQLASLENEHQKVVEDAASRHSEMLEELDGARQEACRLEAEHREALAAAAAREAELQQRLLAVEQEHRLEWRRVMDDLRKDKDSKLQVTAGRCKELQDEVQSLQAVVELRSQEIQDLRRQNAELTWAAEEVQGARLRIQSLQARVEDLQAQLRDKTTFERQLSQENKHLLESFHEENKQKKRLSQHNEELQYKLRQSKEYMLAALSTSLRNSQHSTAANTTGSSPSPDLYKSVGQHMSEPRNFLQFPVHAADESSPPQSPKVKSMVQKGDSVSWTLAMEEAPEIYSRLIRRAGSFRAANTPTSNCSPSPARSRTLPPPKRQRCKASSLCLSSSAVAISPRQTHAGGSLPATAGRCRSRSVSADSTDDAEAYDWPSDDVERNLLEEFGSCGGESRDSPGHEANGRGTLLGPGDVGPAKRSSPSESSNEADSPSKSSTSSSASSNGPVQKAKGAEHSRAHRRRKCGSSQLNLVSSASESMDNTDPEVLPLPPLPGSSSSGDLSLLAACSAVQTFKMPKESGGEAMISEEISEDENQRDAVNSSSDEQSSSDEDGSSSSLEMVTSGNAAFVEGENGAVARGQAGGGDGAAFHKLQYQRLLSTSANHSTVDGSWSEDLELVPSESEG